MLEFLILLPLVMVTILSVTFQVSIDELSNASRGNYLKYDTSKSEQLSLKNKVIYINRILTPWGEEVVTPEYVTTADERHLKCTCSCEDGHSKKLLNLSTCKCECQQVGGKKSPGTKWEVDCHCICPSSIPHSSAGVFFSPGMMYRSIPTDYSSGIKKRKTPV